MAEGIVPLRPARTEASWASGAPSGLTPAKCFSMAIAGVTLTAMITPEWS
jgi:hypothetical protein